MLLKMHFIQRPHVNARILSYDGAEFFYMPPAPRDQRARSEDAVYAGEILAVETNSGIDEYPAKRQIACQGNGPVLCRPKVHPPLRRILAIFEGRRRLGPI